MIGFIIFYIPILQNSQTLFYWTTRLATLKETPNLAFILLQFGYVFIFCDSFRNLQALIFFKCLFPSTFTTGSLLQSRKRKQQTLNLTKTNLEKNRINHSSTAKRTFGRVLCAHDASRFRLFNWLIVEALLKSAIFLWHNKNLVLVLSGSFRDTAKSILRMCAVAPSRRICLSLFSASFAAVQRKSLIDYNQLWAIKGGGLFIVALSSQIVAQQRTLFARVSGNRLFFARWI